MYHSESPLRNRPNSSRIKDTFEFTPPNMKYGNVRFSDLVNTKISAYIRSSDPIIVAAHIIDFEIEKNAPFINGDEPSFESICQAAYINNLGTPNASYFMPENFPSFKRIKNVKDYKSWLIDLCSYKNTFMIPDVLLYDTLVEAANAIDNEKFKRFVESCSNRQIMLNRPILWAKIYFRVHQLTPIDDPRNNSFIKTLSSIFQSDLDYTESELIQEVVVAIETWTGEISKIEYSMAIHYFWKYCPMHMNSLCERNSEYNTIKFLRTKEERPFLIGSVAKSHYYNNFDWKGFIEALYFECSIVNESEMKASYPSARLDVTAAILMDSTSNSIENIPYCGFCGSKGHKVKTCPLVELNMKSGNVVKENGKYYFKDGTVILFNPILPPAVIRYTAALLTE